MINDTECAGIVDACVRSRITSAVDDRIPTSMLSEKPPKPVEPEPLTRRDAPKSFQSATTRPRTVAHARPPAVPTLRWSGGESRAPAETVCSPFGELVELVEFDAG